MTLLFRDGKLEHHEPKITIGIDKVSDQPVTARELAKQMGCGKTKAAEILKARRR